MIFRGVFDHTLDSKNRITVPRQYKGVFTPTGAVLGVPLDGKPCIWIALPEDYDSYAVQALGELSPLSAKRIALERLIYGHSHQVTVDARERLMLPGPLIAHASLEREVVIVGAGNRLECWDKKLWQDYREELMREAQEVSADAGAGG